MNLVIFCAICLLPTSLAFGVTFYEIHLGRIDEENRSLVCNQHSFMYQRGDNFTMYLNVNNIGAPVVTDAVAFVTRYTGDSFDETTIYFFEDTRFIQEYLTYDIIIIDVELITDNGCQRQTILEGTKRDEELEPLEAVTKTASNDICLNKNKCRAILYAAEMCRDAKPQVCQRRKKHRNPVDATVAPLDKRQNSFNGIYDLLTTIRTLNIVDTTTMSQNITGSQSTRETTKRDISVTQSATRTPQQDISSTRCTKEKSKGAETSYFTVMIVTSSIAAVTLVSLLIISIRHFCWKKYNSPGSQQIVPTNENRYYENILFGPDCLQEINQPGHRACDRPPSELNKNLYEEINNYLNHR